MPPKNSKTGKAKQKPQEEQREEFLQAVVLADSFETRFFPFTIERPRCLLPLANTPLIEYTLEFLANTGVQDVFVYCGSHAEQVEDYLHASRWKQEASPFRAFSVFKSAGIHSAGDAMRDLDARDVITGDFLLVSGDVVSNLQIEPALTRHKARREKNKDAIMTMILREAGHGHRTKSEGSRPVFVIDPTEDRCLYYEEIGRRKGISRYLSLEPDLTSSHGELEVRNDLIDCHIDICTSDVLLQWSDNFDFQSLRKSFLRGVLKDYETYGKTIHTYIVADQYAARVKSLRAYGAISKDIRGRWSYPCCPDGNLLPGQTYHQGKWKNYQENSVSLGRTSTLRESVVGAETSIGNGSNIVASTLGRRCKIGKNVKIHSAYIWDDVVIEDDSVVEHVIVADGAHIGRNCRVEQGALISFRARVTDNIIVSAGRKLTRSGYTDLTEISEDDSEVSSVASSHLVYQNDSASTSISSISTFASADEDIDPQLSSSRRESIRSDASDDVVEDKDFHLEATASILDGLQKGEPADTVILELNGLRMSTNASQHQVRKSVVAAFLKRTANIIAGDPASGTEGISTREAVKQVFAKYKEIIERVLFDKESNQKVDQVDFLILLQTEVSGQVKGDQLLLFAAKEIYDLDIIQEDGLLQWWDDERSQEGEMAEVRGLTEQFVTFLKEAQEESEEDEEEEDDDEQEEEDDEN